MRFWGEGLARRAKGHLGVEVGEGSYEIKGGRYSAWGHWGSGMGVGWRRGAKGEFGMEDARLEEGGFWMPEYGWGSGVYALGTRDQ